MNNAINISASGILANDSDIDSTILTVSGITLPIHGILILESSGGFTYTPDMGYIGLDSFQYVTLDGSG